MLSEMKVDRSTAFTYKTTSSIPRIDGYTQGFNFSFQGGDAQCSKELMPTIFHLSEVHKCISLPLIQNTYSRSISPFR